MPAVLHGLVETMANRRPTGEWHLQLDGRAATGAPLIEIVETFLDAFPYAGFSKIELYPGEEADERAWSVADGPDALEVFAANGYGFDATLDLTLFWQPDDEEPREATLPESAELLFTRDVPTVTLTLWPNLFTDALRLPERVPAATPTPRYVSELVVWPAAAARNRARLEASLRRWERASGGTIEHWIADRVEPIGRYGFPASAEPR
ncbi:hypothetical protein C8N24_2583 [Solirubrobacter pauli]|uniref:Uncharacterized protein n=1 Tax=Solirubrobacter pauli TaxID=166793 RepID=A0A660LFN1_9ACTN|nr:hypothetical protein C8N24_2583 [Solirubrobacter pauli]